MLPAEWFRRGRIITAMSNTETMKNNRKKTRPPGFTGIWVMLLLCFIAELFLYTWCRVQCIDVGYEIAKAASREKELETLNKNLKIELASLKSPARIAKIAKNKLGLTPPTPEQTIVIE